MNDELKRSHVILNLGAGVQSTTLYLMALHGELHFDKAIFADVGEEPESVHKHLAWLKTLGGPEIVTVSQGKLGEDLKKGQNGHGGRSVSIPAFTSHTEGVRVGMVRRQCTSEYKIKPIERWLKRELLKLAPGSRVPKDVTVSQIYGISLDESARALRIKANTVGHWRKPVFPLIDRWMTRAACITWIKSHGYPVPPRSACVFCPYKTDREWLRLRTDDAAGWNRAVEIDRALRLPGVAANRRTKQKLYVHDSCRPLEEVHLSDKDRGQIGFWSECEGMCGN